MTDLLKDAPLSHFAQTEPRRILTDSPDQCALPKGHKHPGVKMGLCIWEWGQLAGLPYLLFRSPGAHFTKPFIFAADDCKELIKLPKVKCLRNNQRQGGSVQLGGTWGGGAIGVARVRVGGV